MLAIAEDDAAWGARYWWLAGKADHVAIMSSGVIRLNRTGRRLFAGALLFLASGFAALVYQVIWQRVLGVFSGVHIYSITVIISAFMAGLGLGSLLGGRVADRLSRRRAIVGFGLCELLIGAFCLQSPWLYYDVAYHHFGFLVSYPAALPIVHFTLLVVPTLLMGASLPLLSKGLVEETDRAAGTIGLLYGLNTLGAAFGAFVTVWWFIGALGFEGTIQVAVLLNVVAGCGALLLQRGFPKAEAETARSLAGSRDGRATDAAESLGTAGTAGTKVSTWALTYGLSGFIALSLELLWFRVLDVSIKSSPYTFGHILGMFLFFMGLGSAVGVWRIRHSQRPAETFLWGQWSISLYAGLAVVVLTLWPVEGSLLERLYGYWATNYVLQMVQIVAAWDQLQGWPLSDVLKLVAHLYVFLPIGLLALPTFLMGFTYVYVQRVVQTEPTEVGWRVGVMQASNIVGSILGSILTGTLLLSVLGTPGTLRLLILAGSVFGVLAALRRPASQRLPLAVVVVTLSMAVAGAIPASEAFWGRLHGYAGTRLVTVEDASSIVTLRPRADHPWALLSVNGTGHSWLPFSGGHAILGALPALLADSPKDVLIIGLGTGTTAWAAGCAPGVEQIDVFEIAAPEYEAVRRYIETNPEYPATEKFQADPRFNIQFSDGRLALRVSRKKYDVIEADALEPYMAYSGNLYSREFFEEARQGLKPGGVFCTYTPSQRTRNTVVEVFPYILDFREPGLPTFMIASNEPLEFDRNLLRARLQSAETRACFGTSRVAKSILTQLDIFVTASQIERIDPSNRHLYSGGEINTDLFPRDEYDKSLRTD